MSCWAIPGRHMWAGDARHRPAAAAATPLTLASRAIRAQVHSILILRLSPLFWGLLLTWDPTLLRGPCRINE